MEQLWKQLNPNNNEQIIAPTETEQYKDNWKADVLGTSQRIFVDAELAQMRAGNTPDVYKAFIAVLDVIPVDGLSFIDLACSTGYYSEVAEYALPGKIVYYGSDYNPSSVAMAKKLYPKLDFFEQDLTALTFSDREFNIAMAAGVLEHIPDQTIAFDELCRVANDFVLCHRMKFVEGEEYFTKGSQYNVDVVRYYYNRDKFIQRLSDRGFDMVASIQIYPHTHLSESFLFQRKV
jgi:ubiquinone/menaquinone biosynthesis C-methylase UbiE